MGQVRVRKQRHRDDRATIVAMPQPRDSWEAAVSGFLADCRRRNLSVSTLENYSWWLTGPRLTAFRSEHRINTPRDLTAELLKRFESDLVDAGLRPSSVDSFHRHAKNFIGYCLRNGTAADERALQVDGPRLSQSEPEVFSADEERLLLSVLQERPRDLMLVELLLRTGLRLQEVANLTVDDVVEGPQGAFIRVRQGKGRKDRIVPLDTPRDRASVRLRRYIDKVRPAEVGQRALFLTERKDGSGTPQPLSASAIQTMFTRISRETGIHVNPHKFRHTFATRSLAAGVDVMALQKALGHTTLAMVSRYVHYQSSDILQAWNRRRD